MREKLAATCTIFILTLLSIPTLALADLFVETNANSIWLGEDITITCYSDNNMTGSVEAKITSPITQKITGFNAINSMHYFREYKPPVAGLYKVYCTNSNLTSVQRGFEVSNIYVKIESMQDKVYADEPLEIRVNLVNKTDTERLIKDDVDFEVFIDNDFRVELDRDNIYFNGDYWIIKTKASLSRFEGSTATVKVKANYQGKFATDETQLEVMNPTIFTLKGITKELYTLPGPMIVKLQSIKQGTNIFPDTDIEVFFDGVSITYERLSDGVKFDMPEKSPGTYGLQVKMKYGEEEVTFTKEIKYAIEVSGTAKDAGGNGLSGKIIFSRDDKSQITDIKVGSYSQMLDAGNYDVELQIDPLNAKIKNTKITENMEDVIRFDNFGGATIKDLEGFKIASAVALEVLFDFDSVDMEIDYDASKINNYRDIKVFSCSDWNFDARYCIGGWEEIEDTELDEKTKTVSFTVSHLSAFILGERKSIQIDMKLDKDEYYINEYGELSGITRMDTKNLANVNLVYSFDGHDFAVESDKNGAFSTRFKVPEKAGVYKLVIRPTDVFYGDVVFTKEFKVSKKMDFSIVVPINTNIESMRESEIEFSVINTGQDSIRNLILEFSGFPEEWSVDQDISMIPLLPSGSEEKFILKVTPTNKEKQNVKVSVTGSSSDLERTEEFLLVSRAPETVAQVQKVEEPQEAKSIFNFAELTGMFTLPEMPAINMGDSLFVLGILVVGGLIVFKIKGRTFRKGSARFNMINHIQLIRKEVNRDAEEKARGSKTRSSGTRKRAKPIRKSPTRVRRVRR